MRRKINWLKVLGLSRVYLNRNLDLNSNNDNLANSNENGRMTLGLRPYSMKIQEQYEQIISIKNLFHAWKKARKHKTKKDYVIEFSRNLGQNLIQLQKELINQTYSPKSLKTFILRDPKTRKISKSAFRDRIVHHALVRVIEPLFDKSFIYDSCANRVGRGNLFALKRFDEFKRKVSKNQTTECFVLKADIKHYFQEVNHDVLLKLIKRKITDPKVLWLIGQIINNQSSRSGGGEAQKACLLAT